MNFTQNKISFIEYMPAVFSGFLLTLTFPKTGFHWLAWVALVPVLVSIAGSKEKKPMHGRKAFNAGLAVGMAHFLTLLYWIVNTVTVYGGIPWFLALSILIVLSFYLALYTAMFILVLARFKYDSLFMPLKAAALWVGLEYLRSFLFTGFPWGILGYSQYMNTTLIQIADVTGVYGVSFIIVFFNCVVAMVWCLAKERGNLQVADDIKRSCEQLQLVKISGMKKIVLSLISLVLVLGIVSCYGKIRLACIDQAMKQSEKKVVAVVQGNIRQDLKWDAAFKEKTIKKYCSLSRQAGMYIPSVCKEAGLDAPLVNLKATGNLKAKGNLKVTRKKLDCVCESLNGQQELPDLIVWPETALPFYYTWDKQYSDMVDACIREIKTCFLIGSPAFKPFEDGYELYNRAFMINRFGVITGQYDKIHLVPFGEYVPFGKYLSFLGKLTAQAGDFTPGSKDAEPLLFKDAKAGVLICFEIIFPSLAGRVVKNGADILVTITNDAWFGLTSAPYQHFSMAVFRAVENRRAVARAANTGISGFIDPCGRIGKTTALYEEKYLTQSVACLKNRTFYTSFGDLFALICLCFIVIEQLLLKNIVHPDESAAEIFFPRQEALFRNAKNPTSWATHLRRDTPQNKVFRECPICGARRLKDSHQPVHTVPPYVGSR